MLYCLMFAVLEQTQCDGDFLEIRDGDSLGSPLVARYCGVLGSAPVITSSGTHMLLHFVSDDVTDNSHRGFTLHHTGKSFSSDEKISQRVGSKPISSDVKWRRLSLRSFLLTFVIHQPSTTKHRYWNHHVSLHTRQTPV